MSVIVEALAIGRHRLVRRPLPRPRARERAVLALRRRRPHAAEQRPAVRDADDRRLARAGDPRDADRELLPGSAGDDGSADRRRSRGSDAAERAARCDPRDDEGSRRDRFWCRRPWRSPSRAKPGTTLVTVVLAVVFMIVTLFGFALFRSEPSRRSSRRHRVRALVYGLFGSGLGTTRCSSSSVSACFSCSSGLRGWRPRSFPALSSLTSPVAAGPSSRSTSWSGRSSRSPYWSLRYAFWGPGRGAGSACSRSSPARGTPWCLRSSW